MLEDLKESVVKLLVGNHDFTMDEAEESVNESVAQDEGMWHENADVSDLAKYLASDDDDE